MSNAGKHNAPYNGRSVECVSGRKDQILGVIRGVTINQLSSAQALDQRQALHGQRAGNRQEHQASDRERSRRLYSPDWSDGQREHDVKIRSYHRFKQLLAVRENICLIAELLKGE